MKQNKKKLVQKTSIRSRRSRGMAMATTMFVIMTMASVALIGVVAQTPNNTGQGGLASHVSESQVFGKRRAELYVSQTLAEDGVRMVMQWLNQNRQPPQNNSAFAPSETTQANCPFMSTTNALDHWNTVDVTTPDGKVGHIMVRMYPFKKNNISGRKQFIIESMGEINGVKQMVQATAVQQTFAKYAFFADKMALSPGGDYSISFISEANAFKGPVHINGMLMDGSAVNPAAKIKIRWQPSTSTKPQAITRIFRYNGPTSFTTSLSDSQITWMDMNGAPATTSNWGDVIATGAAPRTGSSPYNVKPITMPVSTTSQKDSATNGFTPTHAGAPEMLAQGMTSGSELKKGGIYINGNVSNVILKATGTGNTTQVIEVIQNWDGAGTVLPWQTTASDYFERRATITMNPVANTTTIVNEKRLKTAGAWGGWTTTGTNSYTGTSNGVIFFEGNVGDTTTKVGGLSGAIANNVMAGSTVAKVSALTIVTAPLKTVQINGGIIFANTQDVAKGGGTVSNPTGSLGSSATDPVVVSGTDVAISGLLGIVTNKVLVTQTDVGGGNFSYTSGANSYVDLSIHAIVMAYDTIEADAWSTRPPGNCHLIGGFIAAAAKPMGAVGTQINPSTGAATVTVYNGFNVERNYDARGASAPPPFYPAPAGASFLMTSMQLVTAPLEGNMPSVL
jgi:hypothetical protein